MLTEKIKQNKSLLKPLLEIGSLVLAGYLGITGLNALQSNQEPIHMKDIYKLTRIQRNGTHVYEDGYWMRIDEHTKKRVVNTYFDKDNNGAPESGYTIFPDHAITLNKYKNERDAIGIIIPSERAVYNKGKLVYHHVLRR